ncbi:hypothetical protein WJX75_006105 [Coccomyxa subellipsoidea]|uniref:Uncharacterized protein n=1 Tax=Coccomyxa subellipsoidea TaxID=248742 RepID=A0ABR2YHY8_9CHLO
MLVFLRTHRTGGLNAAETEQLQKQIQKALWLHPQGTKEGVEEAVAYLTKLGDASDSSMHPTETRPAMPASAPVDIVPIANNDGPSGAQPDKIRQPMSVRTAGVERNVQTEVHKDVQTTASQLAAAAAHVQLEIPLDRPLQFHRPIKDRLVHSSGEASRREVAPGPSMTADFKQTMGSFSAAQAQSYLAPTQLLPVQALHYPAVLRWPLSINAPAAPPLFQQHSWGSGLSSGAPSQKPQALVSEDPIGSTSPRHPHVTRPSSEERVEDPGLPVFDYTRARAALAELQKAPDSRLGPTGPRRVPQGPSQTPNARSDLRKRAVSPTWQSTARPATPPGFAPPPAPKRAHLAFGTRAAPPPSASLPGTPAAPAFVPRVASLGIGKSGADRQAASAHQKTSARPGSLQPKGEAKHSKAAIPGEAQQEGSLLAETRRDDALRALAALLLQPQTLQLLRPDRERASISSSSDNDDPRRGNCLSTPPMAHSRADADANRNARVPVMADKATQYSPDRDRRPSDALHSDQAAQEVIAEELAQLLDSWDGAAGSLPSALHGLAQRRASPLPPAAAAAPDGAAPQGTPLQHGTPPEDAKGSSHQLTAEDTARGVQQQHGPPAETLAGPSQEDAGGCSQQLERQVAAEEAARGVQQRVQELLLRQQAAAADPLLDAVLETLAEASLERLHARTPETAHGTRGNNPRTLWATGRLYLLVGFIRWTALATGVSRIAGAASLTGVV